MTQARVGWRTFVTSVVNTVDADATAFISAAGITNLTQAAAINTLVNDLKTYGLWSKMKALYPMVGGTTTSHKFNLKDPRDLNSAFRLAFNGNNTHSSDGAIFSGNTGYANTNLIPSTTLSQNSKHISVYVKNTSNSFSGSLIGVNAGAIDQIAYQGVFFGNLSSSFAFASLTSTNGFYLTRRISSTTTNTFKNNSLFYTDNLTSSGNPTAALFLNSRNDNGSASYIGNNVISFASIGDGLTDTESSNFYNSVQKFQTTLGRQVGSPIVSDTDAQAFINAAGLTDLGQSTAINTLVTDLKSAGIWTKMKAIYPFVGGTATSHKFNLKDPRDLDAAYRLTFAGGWTHNASGAQSNGTTGYANLNINANQIFTSTDGLMGIYTPSTSISGGSYIYGVSNMADSEWSMAQSSGSIGFGMYRANPVSVTTALPGLSAIGMETNGNRSVYKNNSRLASTSAGFIAMPQNLKMYLSARNANGNADGFSGGLYSFSFISSTLTLTEYSAFYTAVQKYQTTLGRQVGTPVLESGQTANLLDTYSSAAAAYSLRKLRTGYYGFAIRVRRSSDNLEQDIAFKADGTLDTTSLLAFVGSGNGFVTTWYDQSGNNQHATQTTAAYQPYIVNAGSLYSLNGKAIIRNPNANVIRCLITPVSSIQSRPVSIIASGRVYGLPANGFGNPGWYLGGQISSGGGGRYEFTVNPSGFSVLRRGVSSGVSVSNGTNINSPFIQQGHFGSTTLTNRFNGVDATTAITDTDQFTAASNFVLIGANSNQTDFMANIGMYEYIFYFTDRTSDRVAIESNINSYYSVY